MSPLARLSAQEEAPCALNLPYKLAQQLIETLSVEDKTYTSKVLKN